MSIKNKSCIFLIVSSLFIVGCGSKKPKLDPNDPLFDQKNKFYSRYQLWVHDDELSVLISLTAKNLIDNFIEEFWRIRDIDPTTSQNEYKDMIDQRIAEVEGGIFSTFREIAGTRFSVEADLNGDMAHVYLLYGRPNTNCYDCIQRISSNRGAFVDLMVWYFPDQFNKIRYRFLFYEKYGRINVFRDYQPNLRFEDLLNPLSSPLRNISTNPSPSPEELYEIWSELEMSDPGWIFRGALLMFSDYSDVVIENGKTGKTFGALDPPEPILNIAARLKPTIMGQPENLSDRHFLYNKYHSFIPAELNITDGTLSPFIISFFYSDIDWEIKGDVAEAVLNVRVSFQNKETKEITEFHTKIWLIKTRKEVEEKIKGVQVNNITIPVRINMQLDHADNIITESGDLRHTLSQLINELEPGPYVVNIDFRHAVTKKSTGGWREEVVID